MFSVILLGCLALVSASCQCAIRCECDFDEETAKCEGVGYGLADADCPFKARTIEPVDCGYFTTTAATDDYLALTETSTTTTDTTTTLITATTTVTTHQTSTTRTTTHKTTIPVSRKTTPPPRVAHKRPTKPAIRKLITQQPPQIDHQAELIPTDHEPSLAEPAPTDHQPELIPTDHEPPLPNITPTDHRDPPPPESADHRAQQPTDDYDEHPSAGYLRDVWGEIWRPIVGTIGGGGAAGLGFLALRRYRARQRRRAAAELSQLAFALNNTAGTALPDDDDHDAGTELQIGPPRRSSSPASGQSARGSPARPIASTTANTASSSQPITTTANTASPNQPITTAAYSHGLLITTGNPRIAPPNNPPITDNRSPARPVHTAVVVSHAAAARTLNPGPALQQQRLTHRQAFEQWLAIRQADPAAAAQADADHQRRAREEVVLREHRERKKFQAAPTAAAQADADHQRRARADAERRAKRDRQQYLAAENMRKLQALSVFNCDAINQTQRANRAAGQRQTELDLSRETVVDETAQDGEEESEEEEEEEEEEEAEEEENAEAEATRRTNESFETPEETTAGSSQATSGQNDKRDPLTKAAEVAAASGVQAGNGRPRRSEAARAKPQRYGQDVQVQVQQPNKTKPKSKSKK